MEMVQESMEEVMGECSRTNRQGGDPEQQQHWSVVGSECGRGLLCLRAACSASSAWDF